MSVVASRKIGLTGTGEAAMMKLNFIIRNGERPLR
jgi:hypothetical protein